MINLTGKNKVPKKVAGLHRYRWPLSTVTGGRFDRNAQMGI
jgi:hypothetical protein